MLRKCHGHGLTKGAIIQIFYHGLDESTQAILDITAGGIFLYKSLNQAVQLLNDKVLFELDWSNNLQMKPTQKSVALADESYSNGDNSRLMQKLKALAIKMESQFQSLKEEMLEMRINYNNRGASQDYNVSTRDTDGFKGLLHTLNATVLPTKVQRIENKAKTVIQNGNSLKRTGRDRDGRVIILPLMTADEHIVVQRESKARTTLLQSIPDDHVADFHYMDDARDIWNAVKARFGGNAKSKKMRKSMLKQEFLEFKIGEAEELHKGFSNVIEDVLQSFVADTEPEQQLAYEDFKQI
nr:xylulose kinase-1 [Tanacetum cinerariifolium]